MRVDNITLRMEGPEENNRHLELPVFLEKLRHFQKFLNSGIKGDGREGVVINVMQLVHSSPATLVCQPTIRRVPYTTGVLNVRAVLNSVKEGQGDQLSDDVLSAMENLAKHEPKKIAWSEIATTGTSPEDESVCRMDEGFRVKLAEARGDEYVEISMIDGVLEEINIHSIPHTFKIYDASFSSATIPCRFPKELVGQVQGALGRGVFVSGKFFYRPRATTPYKIDVHEIEVLPPSSELPTLSDLRGIAPDATGDKTPEEFVRELRDQWKER